MERFIQKKGHGPNPHSETVVIRVLSGSNNFSRKSCSRGACSTFEIWSILGLLRIILRCFSSFG